MEMLEIALTPLNTVKNLFDNDRKFLLDEVEVRFQHYESHTVFVQLGPGQTVHF